MIVSHGLKKSGDWSSLNSKGLYTCILYLKAITELFYRDQFVFRYPEKALLLHQKLCIQAHIIVQFSVFLSEDILPIDSIHCLLSFETRMELRSLHFFVNENVGELRLARNMR